MISPDKLDDVEMRFRAREQDCKAAEFAEEVAQFELEMGRGGAGACESRGGIGGGQRAPGDPLADHRPGAAGVPGKRGHGRRQARNCWKWAIPQDLEVEVDVLSSDGVKIRPGTRAWLEQWGGDEPLAGRVRLVEPSAFMKVSALGVEEQRVNVILDFPPGEQPPALADAFRVEARIVIWEQDQVLQVPTGALFRRGDQWAVFVVQDGVARMQTVQIGQRNSLQAQVLDGLQEGDQVILHPSDKVRDGVRVSRRDVVSVHGP